MSEIMHETAASDITAPTTGQGQPEFSHEYSSGEFEGLGSRELLDGYAE
jgi:hypothetical protein